MRLAIIDLGTNSVRFDVHQVDSQQHVRTLHREKLMVRLGQGVFLNGRLDAQAKRRTLQAFKSFKTVIENLKVNRTVAFGTSALRDANDGDRFVEEIKQNVGIEVRIMPGIEEARLISLGILSYEDFGNSKVALVDIGGGSTEISICKKDKTLHSKSFSLGSARLQQLFLKQIPPRSESVKKLRKHIRATLLKKIKVEGWPKVDFVVGSSGTVKALFRILKENGSDWVDRSDLKRLNKKLSNMPQKELFKLPGMEIKRADMFLAGTILFEETLNALGAKSFSFTEFSLRDGVLIHEVERLLKRKKISSSLSLEDLYHRISFFAANEGRIRNAEMLAADLFDRLRSVHKLDANWRIYLQAAVMFRDSGKAVSSIHYPLHSYYIVKNSDFPSIEPWESEFIAKLCLYHDADLPKKEDIKTLGQENIKIFMKLLSILRLVDALDSSPETRLRIKKVQVTEKRVEIGFQGSNLTGLESIRAERKRQLFEKTFGKEVIVKRIS